MQKDVDQLQPLVGGRIPSLDGLRAVAVVLVLCAHACQTVGFPLPSLRPWMLRGALGVEVFFVISGFLITTLMLREIDRTANLDVKAFYLRRVLRIVPAYLCYLLVILALDVSGVVQLRARDWVGAGTYTVNFLRRPTWEVGHIWSLSIEEHFYLLWPLVVVSGGGYSAKRVALGMMAACFVFRWIVLLQLPQYTQMAELWTFTRLDTIAFGCLLAVLAWDPKWRRRLDRWVQNDLLVFAALVALCASVLFLSRSARYSVGVGYSVNAALIALLVWAAIRRTGGSVGVVLNHWSVVAVGMASYSLYLWQQVFLNPGRDAWVNRFPQNLLLACMVASLSYCCVERPILNFRRKITPTTPLNPRSLAPTARTPSEPDRLRPRRETTVGEAAC